MTLTVDIHGKVLGFFCLAFWIRILDLRNAQFAALQSQGRRSVAFQHPKPRRRTWVDASTASTTSRRTTRWRSCTTVEAEIYRNDLKMSKSEVFEKLSIAKPTQDALSSLLLDFRTNRHNFRHQAIQSYRQTQGLSVRLRPERAKNNMQPVHVLGILWDIGKLGSRVGLKGVWYNDFAPQHRGCTVSKPSQCSVGSAPGTLEKLLQSWVLDEQPKQYYTLSRNTSFANFFLARLTVCSNSCLTPVWLLYDSSRISPHWKCGRAARASGPSPHQAGRAIAQWSLQRAERNKKSKRTFLSNPCISCRVSSYPPQKVRLPRVVNESTGKLLVDISMHQGLDAHKDIGPQLLKHCTLLLISPNSPLWGPAMPWGWCPQDFQWALQRWEDICALQVVTLEVIHEYQSNEWNQYESVISDSI